MAGKFAEIRTGFSLHLLNVSFYFANPVLHRDHDNMKALHTINILACQKNIYSSASQLFLTLGTLIDIKCYIDIDINLIKFICSAKYRVNGEGIW
jgi:hypothetical protein